MLGKELSFKNEKIQRAAKDKPSSQDKIRNQGWHVVFNLLGGWRPETKME